MPHLLFKRTLGMASICTLIFTTPILAVGQEDIDPEIAIIRPPKTTHIDDLANELLIQILKFAKDNKNVTDLKLVCKRFHDLVWKGMHAIVLRLTLPTGVDPEAYKEKLQNIQNVCIHRNFGEGGPIASLKIFPKLNSSVKTIKLDNQEISDEEFEALLPTLPASLETLDLSSNQIGAKGAKLLANAIAKKAFPKLQALYLAGNKIGDEGLGALASYLNQLTVFDLKDNEIKNITPLINALVEGKGGKLKEFALTYSNEDGDAKIAELLNALPEGVERLELSRSAMEQTSSGVLINKPFPHLKALNISGNRISVEDTKAILSTLGRHSTKLETLNFGKMTEPWQAADITYLVERFQQQEFKNLKSLSLPNHRIRNKGVMELFAPVC